MLPGPDGRWSNKRLALACVLGLVVMNGGQHVGTGDFLDNRSGGDGLQRVGNLEWDLGFAAVAEAAPSATPRDMSSVPGAHHHNGAGGRDTDVGDRALAALISAYTQGYRDYGGNPAWEARFLDVIECESGWDTTAVSDGGHLGLAQFAHASWHKATEITGLGDWTNPYHQGAAVAAWSSITVPEEQWSCW